MKAAFFRRFGPPEVLEYGDLPDPVPSAGEVLVDIHAASVNDAGKIAVRQEIVARTPERPTHVQCAAVALAGLTALISIEDTLKLRAGETILIQGSAGGVAGHRGISAR